jgi:hypothetical protein
MLVERYDDCWAGWQLSFAVVGAVVVAASKVIWVMLTTWLTHLTSNSQCHQTSNWLVLLISSRLLLLQHKHYQFVCIK